MEGPLFLGEKNPNVNLKKLPLSSFLFPAVEYQEQTSPFSSGAFVYYKGQECPIFNFLDIFLKIVEHNQLCFSSKSIRFSSKHAVVHLIKVTELVTFPFSYLC